MPEDVFCARQLRAVGQGAGPAVPGPDQGAAEQPRRAALVSATSPALELWLNQHVEYGKKLAELVIRQAQTRQRARRRWKSAKGSGVAVLPGKLTDCESRDLSLNEVFLVEGDSAPAAAPRWAATRRPGHPAAARQGAQHREVERDRLFANNEIHDIAVAIGVDPHGQNDEPDLSGLRYGKILHPERRRCRRLAHPGAAADAVLPPFSQADRTATSMSPSRRCSASMRRARQANRPPSSTRWTRAS